MDLSASGGLRFQLHQKVERLPGLRTAPGGRFGGKGVAGSGGFSPLVIGVICERVFVGALNDKGTRDAESVVACLAIGDSVNGG